VKKILFFQTNPEDLFRPFSSIFIRGLRQEQAKKKLKKKLGREGETAHTRSSLRGSLSAPDRETPPTLAHALRRAQ